MRISTLVLIVLTAMMTQSCKIEMPSLVSLIGSYWPNAPDKPSAYNFELSQAMKIRGKFNGALLVGRDESNWNGTKIKSIITNIGISKENIEFFGELQIKDYDYASQAAKDGENFGLKVLFTYDDHYTVSLRETARVVSAASFMPFTHPNDVSTIEAIGNTLFVASTSNSVHAAWKGDNNLFNIQHVYWDNDKLRTDPYSKKRLEPRYISLLRAHKTGKVISVKSAKVVGEKIEPYENAVKCGDIKESCFTIIPAQASIYGSARLSAIAFYLSQFYETPEEIVEVLGACAIDAGVRGTDEEYGRGVINLLCPPVLKKELEIVSSHLNVKKEERESPAGGALEGFWKAEEVPLIVHIPEALRQTLQLNYDGAVNGTIKFTEETAKVDFSAKAAINTAFLLPIEATAEEQIQTEATYATVEQSLFLAGVEGFAYTATADSLHLIRSYSLNEILRSLPYPFWTMVSQTAKDFFVDDPIQIKMSFGKVKHPTAPKQVREKTKTDTTITLVWEEPEEAGESPVSQYRVTQYTDSTCAVVSAVEETEDQEITFKNLEGDTDYFFTVEAGNTAGWSARSVCVAVHTEEEKVPGDFNGDGIITRTDFELFAGAWGSREGDFNYDEIFDLHPDGVIDSLDYAIFYDLFLPGDFNGDGKIDLADYDLFVDAWASREGDPNYSEVIDLNADGVINLIDFQIFSDIWKEHNQ